MYVFTKFLVGSKVGEVVKRDEFQLNRWNIFRVTVEKFGRFSGGKLSAHTHFLHITVCDFDGVVNLDVHV